MALTTLFTFGGMNNVSEPASVGAPDRSLYSQDQAYSKCVDLVNVNVDDNLNAVRRQGYTLKTSAPVTSAWSDGVRHFCVSGKRIHIFDGEGLAMLGNSPTVDDQVEFCQVNDVVLFSDNKVIGLIDQANVPYLISAPSESVDLLDLETWVKLTYPAGADADASNFEIDAFRISTLAGCCLEFFNGAAYIALDNFVYCTRTFDIEHMDIRYNVVAGFKDKVTGIKAVTDGLYVGTEGGVYFLAGTSGAVATGFTQKKVLPFGMIYGSALKAPAAKDSEVVVWLTPNGVYSGADGGECTDLTESAVRMPAGDTAACTLLRQDEARLYVVAVGSEAIAVNLKNKAHSRYTNYDFKAFFTTYGAGDSGVYALTGDTDAGAPVVAQIKTPIVNFGVPQVKRCQDAYLHTRTSGLLTLDILTDEVEAAAEIPFVGKLNLEDGVRQLRANLPRGAKGTNWQFRIQNPDGAEFTALNLRLTPVASKRLT